MSEDLILLVGLPGCGKTMYLCQLCRDGWLIFDDFKANAVDDSSTFCRSRRFPVLIMALRNGLKCAVADIDFCKTESRDEAVRIIRAEIPSAKLSWRFFANDKIACERNIRALCAYDDETPTPC